jgi:L-alanine-DL-glutamate epimerase-like enolase superfamily enzyme
MKLTLYRLNLPLLHEFTIARGSITTQPSLVVELEHDGLSGYGEVTENSFYGHTFDSITASLKKVVPHLAAYATHSPIDLWPKMHSLIDGDMFALSALDIAAHDLRGRQKGVPTWQDWGFEWTNVPDSSYTIGIDTIDNMVAKLNELPGWGIYKIKLGTPQDIEIVTELRKHTDAIFRVDANCGWTVEEAIVNSKALAELNVEFIEQPLPISASGVDKTRLATESALPIIADEDCQTSNDVGRCAGLFHGVNVKICKCGGLTPAIGMLESARQLRLKTMVGCMVESSIGISGAAQLLPLLDYADLDGAVLLKDEPASGATVVNGAVTLSGQAGCGAELIRDRLDEFLIQAGEELF